LRLTRRACESEPVTGRLRLADLLAGLSVASDLGFGLPPETAMRACVVGTALARRMGLPEEEVADVFYATLLLHVGCGALSHETAALFGDELRLMRGVAETNVADPADVEATLVPLVTHGMSAPAAAGLVSRLVEHGESFPRMYDTGSCEVASATARRLGLGEGAARAIEDMDEWWAGGWVPRGLRGDEIALSGRVARAAAEAAHIAGLRGAERAVQALRERSGTILDPAVVGAFAAGADELLAEATTGDPRERLLAVEPEPVVEVPATGLPAVAAAFGDLADLKTPFTHGHSRGVAGLAVGAARGLRLDAQATARVEVAALLHDVGRASVSNVIWEKPAELTHAEWEHVRMHAYHSERILAGSAALEPMARLAGMHHERLDGSGYHRGSGAREIAVECRILAAADAFHAMTQERPHRVALAPERAADELTRDARAGRLDGDCAAAVLESAGQRVARRRSARPGGLSPREVEVVRLVAQGCSNPEIAERLGMARRTAEHHVQHVYAKLGVSSRPALALFAVEHQIV
jgi:HD-GYP domain-containing protein (c-di-GMP phosphodiesterase class II)